jgi:trk system potassium uptake protein TrkH
MVRFSAVFNVLGILHVFIGGCMLLPTAISFFYHDRDFTALLVISLLQILFGILVYFVTPVPDDIHPKEGYAIVAFGWVTVAAVGALPFYFSGAIPSYIDCFFETVSGYTTTGASILTNIESLPKGILFWRSLTHWLGGLGFILLSIAVLPLLGFGGMQLYRSEMTGPAPDKLKPRVQETARILWSVYVLFTICEIVLLMVGGMTLYDAACHTFGTMGTGGFSTKNASIGYYHSAYIDIIVIVFMIIAGTNFRLHYKALKGNIKAYIRDEEFRFFISILMIASLTIFLDVYLKTRVNPGETLRSAVFQVVSLDTTTGFVTADYEKWSWFSQFILFTLLFCGSCAGSTSGSQKMMRILMLIKYGIAEIKRLIHPNAVIPVRFNGSSVSSEIMGKILGFCLTYVSVWGIGSLLLMLFGSDMITSMGGVATCLGGVGPGLGDVGPMDNYYHLHWMSKIVLSGEMLLGRLEIYPFIVLFHPSFWKK